MATTNLSLDFPDDQAQEDFEIAFRGWLKQYQQQAGIARALTGGGGAQGGSASGSTGGLTGGSGSGGHSYGGQGGAQQGSQAGLFSWGGGSGGGYSSGRVYLNFIGGW